jgi:hypothetical protein
METAFAQCAQWQVIGVTAGVADPASPACPSAAPAIAPRGPPNMKPIEPPMLMVS